MNSKGLQYELLRTGPNNQRQIFKAIWVLFSLAASLAYATSNCNSCSVVIFE